MFKNSPTVEYYSCITGALIMFTISLVVLGFIVYAACVIVPSILDELVNSH